MDSVILKPLVFMKGNKIFPLYAFLWQTCWMLIFRLNTSLMHLCLMVMCCPTPCLACKGRIISLLMKHLQWRHKRAWLEQMASCLWLFAFNLLLNSAHQCGLGEKWGLQSAIYEFAVSCPKQQRKLCIVVSYMGIWILPDVDTCVSAFQFSKAIQKTCK